MKILALGAHPDDIEIYMFGTLAESIARGARVIAAIATDGAAGGPGDPDGLRKARRAEATEGAGLLGVEPIFLDFPDGHLSADRPLVDAIRGLMSSSGADLVITHAPNDYHADHRALSEATRMAANFAVPVLWADTMLGVGFLPTHYVDTGMHHALKTRAIAAHRSQDTAGLIARTTALNAFRAMQAHAATATHAEAFRFEPVFPFADIRDMLPPAPPVRPIVTPRHLQ